MPDSPRPKRIRRAGHTVLDSGNSRWTDDEKHAEELAAQGIGLIHAADPARHR